MKKSRSRNSWSKLVKGMFVGNAKNSTNSVSNALGIFILLLWRKGKKGGNSRRLMSFVCLGRCFGDRKMVKRIVGVTILFSPSSTQKGLYGQLFGFISLLLVEGWERCRGVGLKWGH